MESISRKNEPENLGHAEQNAVADALSAMHRRMLEHDTKIEEQITKFETLGSDYSCRVEKETGETKVISQTSKLTIAKHILRVSGLIDMNTMKTDHQLDLEYRDSLFMQDSAS